VKRQKARIIYPGGEERERYPLNLKKFTLQELQQMVGGYIEHVRLPRGNGHAKMYVDEEGLLKGKLFNSTASQICGARIVGVAVIVTTEEAS